MPHDFIEDYRHVEHRSASPFCSRCIRDAQADCGVCRAYHEPRPNIGEREASDILDHGCFVVDDHGIRHPIGDPVVPGCDDDPQSLDGRGAVKSILKGIALGCFWCALFLGGLWVGKTGTEWRTARQISVQQAAIVQAIDEIIVRDMAIRKARQTIYRMGQQLEFMADRQRTSL